MAYEYEKVVAMTPRQKDVLLRMVSDGLAPDMNAAIRYLIDRFGDQMGYSLTARVPVKESE